MLVPGCFHWEKNSVHLCMLHLLGAPSINPSIATRINASGRNGHRSKCQGAEPVEGSSQETRWQNGCREPQRDFFGLVAAGFCRPHFPLGPLWLVCAPVWKIPANADAFPWFFRCWACQGQWCEQEGNLEHTKKYRFQKMLKICGLASWSEKKQYRKVKTEYCNDLAVVINNFWLVVEPPLRKNMKVTWGYDIPNRWKNNTCSKPPTSNNLMLCPTVFLQGGASPGGNEQWTQSGQITSSLARSSPHKSVQRHSHLEAKCLV